MSVKRIFISLFTSTFNFSFVKSLPNKKQKNMEAETQVFIVTFKLGVYNGFHRDWLRLKALHHLKR